MSYYINEHMLSCQYCNKQYVRKSSLNNHLLICKFNNICKYTNSDLYDKNNNINITTISNENIYKLLIDLHNKYEHLKEDYDQLKKFVNISKNKIDILQYLNQHYDYSQFDVNDFIYNIEINTNDLDLIFKKNYSDGLTDILINNIKIMKENGKNIPIKTFTHKEGILYGYFKNFKEWKIIDSDNWNLFIDCFDKKILKTFLKWKEEKEQIMTNDEFSNIYPVFMKKILATNSQNKNIIIKNKLYKYLKVNIKNIVTFEFV